MNKQSAKDNPVMIGQRKITILVLLLIISLLTCFMKAQEHMKSSALVEVLAVEPALGAWSGYTEVDQWILVAVAKSENSQVRTGRKYRIGVAVAPGRLFEKDFPQFDSAVVAVGKRLLIVSSKDCIRLANKKNLLKISAECISPVS